MRRSLARYRFGYGHFSLVDHDYRFLKNMRKRIYTLGVKMDTLHHAVGIISEDDYIYMVDIYDIHGCNLRSKMLL